MTELAPGPVTLRLRLYVAGSAPNALLAIANAKAICDAHFAEAHELEIIDVLEETARALEDRIVVTPTLMKLSPLPIRRLIGNLSDTRQVVLTLGAK